MELLKEEIKIEEITIKENNQDINNGIIHPIYRQTS